MKYIKEYKDEFNNITIDGQTFLKLLKNEIDFSKSDIDTITKVSLKYNVSLRFHDQRKYIQFGDFGSIYGRIAKLDDDWFLLSGQHSDFVKCDTIDGLMYILSEIFEKISLENELSLLKKELTNFISTSDILDIPMLKDVASKINKLK